MLDGNGRATGGPLLLLLLLILVVVVAVAAAAAAAASAAVVVFKLLKRSFGTVERDREGNASEKCNCWELVLSLLWKSIAKTLFPTPQASTNWTFSSTKEAALGACWSLR